MDAGRRSVRSLEVSFCVSVAGSIVLLESLNGTATDVQSFVTTVAEVLARFCYRICCSFRRCRYHNPTIRFRAILWHASFFLV